MIWFETFHNDPVLSKILFTQSPMSVVPSVFPCFCVFVISSHFFVTLQNFIMNAPPEGLDKTCAAGFFQLPLNHILEEPSTILTLLKNCKKTYITSRYNTPDQCVNYPCVIGGELIGDTAHFNFRIFSKTATFMLKVNNFES